jgi:formylglycine-generating enzyme required for sulfatase activity
LKQEDQSPQDFRLNVRKFPNANKDGQEEKPRGKVTNLDLGGGHKMKLVRIEPGQFMMGSPKNEADRFDDEGPMHEVEITKPFFIGVYAVTQEEYEKVAGKNPSDFKGARLPVENVPWDDAIEFCRKLSQNEGKTIDLPTEAEWEYACRGGSAGPFHYGSALSSKQANFVGSSPYGGAAKGPWLEKTVPVGSYEPNALGLYDMHGNVWQWCKDWYKADFYEESPRRDPQGPAKGERRVLRGGSWGSVAASCRSASRTHDGAGDRFDAGGFRVVMRLP